MSRQPWRIDRMEPAPELLAVQHLMPIDEVDRARLKESIFQEKRVRDALRGYFGADGKFKILAGLNRWEIARELVRDYPNECKSLALVSVELVEVADPGARSEFAIRDNLDRRHLTQTQKRLLIDYMLTQTPGVSDRSIGQAIGADHKTVAARRSILQSTGEIPRLAETRGRDGKSRVRPAARRSSLPKVAISKKSRSLGSPSVSLAEVRMVLKKYLSSVRPSEVKSVKKKLQAIIEKS